MIELLREWLGRAQRAQRAVDALGAGVRRCRVCGCTDADCHRCVARTGSPCWWVAADLCSACVPAPPRR